MTGPILRAVAAGDSAVLVRVEAGIGQRERGWRAVQRLADALEAAPIAGQIDLVATYDSLLIEFDCAATCHRAVLAAVSRTHEAAGATDGGGPAEPRSLRIPVVYGGAFGPDLEDVAAELGWRPAELVECHAATEWVVRFRGAPAGAPMLDGWSPPCPVRRRPSPRVRVAAGSVAVAGAQSVVYPVASPGGWRLIGRTPARLVDLDRTPHVPYRPGQRLRFVPVPATAWPDGAVRADGGSSS